MYSDVLLFNCITCSDWAYWYWLNVINNRNVVENMFHQLWICLTSVLPLFYWSFKFFLLFSNYLWQFSHLQYSLRYLWKQQGLGNCICYNFSAGVKSLSWYLRLKIDVNFVLRLQSSFLEVRENFSSLQPLMNQMTVFINFNTGQMGFVTLWNWNLRHAYEGVLWHLCENKRLRAVNWLMFIR